MAMNYYPVPEQGKVIGVLNGCAYDAIRKIERITNDTCFCAFDKKYLMPNTFRAVAKCSEDDVYNEQTGKDIAKQKVMDKYYDSLDRRMLMFFDDVYKLYHKCFEDDEHGSAD